MAGLFTRLVRPPRPPHAFVLTRERLVYVRREARIKADASLTGGSPYTVLARNLPEGALVLNGGGVPSAGAPLARVVAELLNEAGGRVPAASLVIPDSFVHVLAVDLPEPEKNVKETVEVLEWKLGKTFGDPPPPVRLAWQTAGSGTSGTRVVAIAAPEEAAASWENAFAPLRIGALETASLAISNLGRRIVQGNGFLLWADGETATTLFLKNGDLRFVRTKTTSDPDEALQEIRLAASFVANEGLRAGAEPPALDVEGLCAAGPWGSPVIERFRAFRAEAGGRDPQPLTRATLLAEAAAPKKADDDPAVLAGLCALTAD